MSAEQFEIEVEGKTAASAFHKARKRALYDYGHAGYTGTIAEKSDFEIARGKPETMEPYTYLEFLLLSTSEELTLAQLLDRRVYNDKWGPALCIPLDEHRWLFCGWASS